MAMINRALLTCILLPWAILHLILLGTVIAAMGGVDGAMTALDWFLSTLIT